MEAKKYVGPARFSWSAAEKWDQCGRKGWFHYADGLREPVQEHLVRGSFVHRVLELAVGRRVDGADGLRALCREVFDGETVCSVEWGELVAGGVDGGLFRQEVWRHVVNGFELLCSGRLGAARHVELQVDTRFGDVPFLGFVDVVVEEGGVLRTLDWKTGKVWDMRAGAWRGGQAWNAKKLFQPVLYAQAVEELLGCRVDGGLVAFTGVRPVEVLEAEDRLRGEAVGWLNGVWGRVAGWVKQGEAEPSTGPLCGWCAFVDRCEQGRVEVAGRVAAGRPVGDGLGWLLGVSPGVRQAWVESGVREPEAVGVGFSVAEFRQAAEVVEVEPLPDPTVDDVKGLLAAELRRPVPRAAQVQVLVEVLRDRFGLVVEMPVIDVKPRFMDDDVLVRSLRVELARDKPRRTKVEPLRREVLKRGLSGFDAA